MADAENPQATEIVDGDIPTEVDPEDWGVDGDGATDPETGAPGRFDDWSWDTLDIVFEGYDTQLEADADREGRAERFA